MKTLNSYEELSVKQVKLVALDFSMKEKEWAIMEDRTVDTSKDNKLILAILQEEDYDQTVEMLLS